MSPVPFNVVDGCLVGWVGHQVLGGVLKVKKQVIGRVLYYTAGTSTWRSTSGKQQVRVNGGVLEVNSRYLEEY